MTDNNNIAGMTKPPTEADALRNLQQTQNNAANGIISATQVKIDKDTGKGYVLGMELSPEAANIANYVVSLAPSYLNDFLKDGAYAHSKKAFEYAVDKLKIEDISHNSSHNFGLKSALAVSGLLIGFQPLMEVVHSVGQEVKKKSAIKEQMADVIASNGGNWKDNEVIKTAMEKADSLMWDGVKGAVAMLPTVFMNGMYALQGHKELTAKKNEEFFGNLANSSHKNSVKTSAEFAWEEEQKLKAKRKEFIDKKLEANQEGNTEDFGKFFDQHHQQELDDKRAERLARASSTQIPVQENTDSKLLALNLAGMGNVVLGQALKKSEDAKAPTAYSMILKLQDKFANGDIFGGASLTKNIIDIIQQNEKERGRSAIGKVLLEKLEPLAERIGEVIARGEIEPLALIDLVGGGKIVKNRVFVSEDKLEEILDVERKTFGTHQKTSYEEFLADFQNPDKIMKIISDNLKTLTGDEKALFATLLSEDVLLRAGVSKKDIQPLREQGHDFTYDFMIKQTQELAQHKPEELKEKYSISEQEIKGIMNLNKLIEAGKQEEVKSEIDSGKFTKSVIATSLQEMATIGKTWAEKVGKPTEKSLLEKIKPEHHAKHDVEAANDRHYSDNEEIEPKHSHTKHAKHQQYSEGRV